MTDSSTTAVAMAASAITDEEVIDRVRGGETGLFEIIMRRYNQRLYRAARSILRDDTEAEDVMQEAYVRAYRYLNQFDGRAKFSTWLTRIAVNEALGRLRARRKLVDIEASPESMENKMALGSNTPSQEQEVLNQTLRVVLESAVDRLPDSYRAVFMLRDVEEMSTAETAECLEITEESVRVRLHRARTLLRKEIYNSTGATTGAAFQFGQSRCDRMVAAVMARIQSIEGGQ